MRIAVVANEHQKEEFLSKQIPAGVQFYFTETPQNIPVDTDIIFDLLFSNTAEHISVLKQFLPRLVFINAVTDTLAAVNEPFVRINAWPTFLKRNITEVVAKPLQENGVKSIFEKLGWSYRLVPDITGMISPRIICTVINEAYYTLGEKVSTKNEIDIAMKLGTNYPYGPFEWAEKIGLKNIYDTLVQLSNENNIYKVSALLTNEIII